MVKIISIRDDVYKKLLNFKRANSTSFSDAIDTLLNFYKAKKPISKQLSGTLKESDLLRSRLKRIMHG
ncbi:MAG: antitoxin VapB family protein [Candidatus Anstonellales archaeon]